MSKKEIRICTEHGEQIPLLWTFAFKGAEYWCPFCGATYGMMGAGEKVEETKELKTILIEYKKKTRKFLNAKSTIECDAKMLKGVWVNNEDLPKIMIDKARKVVSEFKYDSDAV